MKQIETQITIDATPEKVWDILTDFDRYPEWNPFIKSISGEKRAGGYLKVFLKPPEGKGMTFKPELIKFAENKEFRWKGKLLVKGLFDGEHYFILKKNSDGSTQFIHGEKFSGILVKIFSGILDKTLIGFQQMNTALKARSEK